MKLLVSLLALAALLGGCVVVPERPIGAVYYGRVGPPPPPVYYYGGRYRGYGRYW